MPPPVVAGGILQAPVANDVAALAHKTSVSHVRCVNSPVVKNGNTDLFMSDRTVWPALHALWFGEKFGKNFFPEVDAMSY